ncbi:MAG: RsmD family RNA methyltransferase [Saprospiraceae bacterium]|nr:RsmD family RNA methyltransferase [Saprospiraceae bacterium]
MRIIGGNLKGRRFNPPADKWPTRPTTDFAKEGLFNILANRFDFADIKMLDLFGGTGSHTYEAISRGCQQVTYVDKHRPCVFFVRELATKLQITDKIQILSMDVARFLKQQNGVYDYIFAGPPYPLTWLDDIPDLIFEAKLLAADGLFVLEHNANHVFKTHPHFEQLRTYGGTHFSFFSLNQSIDD